MNPAFAGEAKVEADDLEIVRRVPIRRLVVRVIGIAHDFDPDARCQSRNGADGREPGGREHHDASGNRPGGQGDFEKAVAAFGLDAQRAHIAFGDQLLDARK